MLHALTNYWNDKLHILHYNRSDHNATDVLTVKIFMQQMQFNNILQAIVTVKFVYYFVLLD